MPTFTYEAMDSQGNTVKDTIVAESEKEANDKIRALNFFPTKVQMQGGGGAAMGTPQAVARKRGGISLNFSVSPKQLTEFTRQFATLLDAGLPVVRSLDILGNQLKPGLLKDTIAEVKEDVEGGSQLSEALSKHPRVFDKLYVNMIKAGEAAGMLDTILARLSEYMEKAQRLKQKIMGALMYPAAVTIIASGILVLIMLVIVPKFQKMFADMELGSLPAITEVLILVANVLKNFWYLLIFIPFILWAALIIIKKNPRGQYLLDLIKLKIPIFGVIISKSSVSRFCRTLGTLVQSGVPILNALAIIKNTTGNAVVAAAVENVHNSIREGDTIADPLRHSGVFDDMVVNMIAVGEETGELDKMLIKVADNFDNDVDALVGGLMSLLEPLLIIGMGGAVAFIVIALFMPMVAMMERLSGGA